MKQKRLKMNYCLLALMLVVMPFAAAEIEVNEIRWAEFGGDNGAWVELSVTNTGTVTESGLFELAFFPDNGLLSFAGGWGSPYTVCDADFPYNVHQKYTLAPGESDSTLILNQEPYKDVVGVPDGTYRVVLSHYSACYVDGGVPKSPIGSEYLLGVVTFGDAAANADDDCDTDSQALAHVIRDGFPNCVEAVCEDPASQSSNAVCTVIDGDGDGGILASFGLSGLLVLLGAVLLIYALYWGGRR